MLNQHVVADLTVQTYAPLIGIYSLANLAFLTTQPFSSTKPDRTGNCSESTRRRRLVNPLQFKNCWNPRIQASTSLPNQLTRSFHPSGGLASELGTPNLVRPVEWRWDFQQFLGLLPQQEGTSFSFKSCILARFFLRKGSVGFYYPYLPRGKEWKRRRCIRLVGRSSRIICVHVAEKVGLFRFVTNKVGGTTCYDWRPYISLDLVIVLPYIVPLIYSGLSLILANVLDARRTFATMSLKHYTWTRWMVFSKSYISIKASILYTWDYSVSSVA